MITERYVIFIRIPLYLRADGVLFAGDLWARDLEYHLRYIANLNLCCPVLSSEEAPDDAVAIDGLHASNVYPTHVDKGWGSILRNFLPNFRSVYRAVRGGGIMHSSGSEWAFPLSYYILALRPFMTFKWVMNIESTFWMLPKEGHAPLRRKLAEQIHSFLVRACIRRADARMFTQDWYRKALYGGTDNCLVSPATWINENLILPEASGTRDPGPLQLVFPTRLTPEKGVRTVLEAAARYNANIQAPPITLDILGEGTLTDELDRAVAAQSGSLTLRRIPTRPYGAPFFELLQGYDAVLVANRTEEQPRIIFDAYSQAVPCIVSGTNGNRSVLKEGETGWIFAPGDAADLAKTLYRAAENPGHLAAMRQNALEQARQNTHARMHQIREKFLKGVFGVPQ